MSSLALMRWLESAPHRYDAGMRWLTLGRVSRLHAVVAAAATTKPESRVLEIGCGTGAITARLVERGARVTALDQNPELHEKTSARLAAQPNRPTGPSPPKIRCPTAWVAPASTATRRQRFITII